MSYGCFVLISGGIWAASVFRVIEFGSDGCMAGQQIIVHGVKPRRPAFE
jgi:hypothetical protein